VSEAPVDDRVLDELVPAPWSTTRRVIVAIVAAALLSATGLLVWAGVLVPNLVAHRTLSGTAEVGDWEDDGIVDTAFTVSVPIENRGWVPATIHEWQPPRTRGLAWEEPARRLPVTLEPGEVVEIEFAARIASCRQADARGTTGVDLITQGPIGVQTTSSVEVVPHSRDLPSWPTSDGDGPITDLDRHEPSWLYNPLAWACDPSAVDLEDRE
jgi:hypothetical protein